MIETGAFVISLDFELHWGSIETKPVLDYETKQYFLNTRNVILEMLSLFETNDMHVTWAVVGMLFNRNPTEWQERNPSITPTYTNKNVSGYEWIKKNGFEAKDAPCHFAPELIEKIKSTKNQEIGTHTYSHYFCLEQGQTVEQFRADMKKACELAAEANLTLHSLVFPRNQYNEEYLSVCKEYGINVVRTCPDIWYWSPTAESGLLRKIARTGDAYIKLQPIEPVYLKDISPNQLPIRLPASRLYRPWSRKWSILNKIKLKRILNEMTAAAKTGAYYHLWWHPENFGRYPTKCMEELEQIIKHYQFLNKKYGFTSYNMHEISNLIKELNN